MQICVLLAAPSVPRKSAPCTTTSSCPALLPSTIVLLAETIASAPMAVAWSRLPLATSALVPMMVLLSPEVFELPAERP